MKRIVYYLLILFSATSLLSCNEIAPLTPPNPVVGNWIIYSHEIYHLPAWFITKTRTEFITTPTDTIYSNATLAVIFNVNSYTFTQDNALSQVYINPYPAPGEPDTKIDKGTWTLADSVISLNVANNFPHKLTYSATLDQLVTDKYPQTSTIRFADGSWNTVSYTIRVFYRRSL